LAKKNKLGLSLRTKKVFFWAKILIKIEFKEEDRQHKKNKLGLSLRTKKCLFWAKF